MGMKLQISEREFFRSEIILMQTIDNSEYIDKITYNKYE